MVGLFEGVTALISAGVVRIVTEPECSPVSFQQVVDLLGVTGRTDYTISYCPETGIETYRFEV